MANKKGITATNVEHKRWNYENGGVSLGFTLRVDVKEEMKNFLEMLKRAQQEIEAEITKRFPK